MIHDNWKAKKAWIFGVESWVAIWEVEGNGIWSFIGSQNFSQNIKHKKDIKSNIPNTEIAKNLWSYHLV